MPLIQVNATPQGPCLGGTSRPLVPVLCNALRQPGPVMIMVHGFKFQPDHPTCCPHRHILSLDPRVQCRKAISWPRALGIGQGAKDEGLGIAFGWSARGTIWQAYSQAALAGRALADLLKAIHRIDPNRPVHVLAHSLGARVALRALGTPGLPPTAVQRVILLSAAEFSIEADRALNSDAGRNTEFISITSRENDLFDFLLERLIRAPRQGDRALGFGLPPGANTLNLQLDNLQTGVALRRVGIPIGAARARICHWSTYLQPGVFDFYRAILREPHVWPLIRLKGLAPDEAEPRWARLRRWEMPEMPLPMGRKASS
ncbi:alpha/beta hydrolase [Pseudohalocynthiibacter aestuariivivens]|nr:alpha/beta hydrolase [Pseudohalocynthiibacter aestuariivivens]QIE46193.1 alpha/beta hydrolase [Pseudohalocynthiibacter aestuariivivens]